MSYAWEKFHGAIHSLLGKGTQQERLASAYIHNLIRLEPEDLPEEIQEDFRQLVTDITRVEGDEGSVKATVSQMDEIEISRMIDKIISMHDTVTRHQDPF